MVQKLQVQEADDPLAVGRVADVALGLDDAVVGKEPVVKKWHLASKLTTLGDPTELIHQLNRRWTFERQD